MRVLHIIPSYLPATYASGPIGAVHNLNKALVKKGIEVVVYTTNIDGSKILNIPLNHEAIIDGVRIYYFPITLRPWQYSYKLHQALAKNIKEFDTIHITSVFLSVSTLGAYYSKKFKKPYIISPHGSLMEIPLKRQSLKKKIYLFLVERRNLADAVIHFVVEKEKEDYLKTKLPFRRLIVVPNIFSPEKFDLKNKKINFREKFNINKDKKIILYIGRLHPIKGFDTLIPAFAEVIKQKSDVVLVLAGDDEAKYKDLIFKLITDYKLRLGENIVLTGWIKEGEIAAAFSTSEIFVYPSYTEAFSMSTLEAMYFYLPVIITKNSGLAEHLKKASAGIVIEKNERQLTEAILRILDNLEGARKMGENGRRLVKTEFSSEKVAGKWVGEYNRLSA